jgi:glycerol dehydrogenase-like iron-containing ADH family enzyme
MVEPLLHHAPAHVALVPDLELGTLDVALATVPEVDAFVGVGAGMAMDAAKYMAWRREVDLFQIPTTTSSNAMFTPSSGVRNSPVRPLGHALPQIILVDYGLIRQAPQALNAAGAADILAAHTALWDWQLAVARGMEPPWDEQVAQEGRGWLRRLDEAAQDVRRLSDGGIRVLMQLHEAMGLASTDPHRASAQAGSEHWWSMNLERITGRHFVHGEIVALGVVIGSWIQRNRPQWARDLVERLGIRYRPADLGLTPDAIRASLEMIPEFLQVRPIRRYSWMDEFRLSEEAWSGLCRWLDLA